MKLSIPKAHGELIAERAQILQQIQQSFQMLRVEDRKHCDAVLITAGLKPQDYTQYTLERVGDEYFLNLTEAAEAQLKSNGVPVPQTEAVRAM